MIVTFITCSNLGSWWLISPDILVCFLIKFWTPIKSLPRFELEIIGSFSRIQASSSSTSLEKKKHDWLMEDLIWYMDRLTLQEALELPEKLLNRKGIYQSLFSWVHGFHQWRISAIQCCKIIMRILFSLKNIWKPQLPNAWQTRTWYHLGCTIPVFLKKYTF